MEGDGGPCGERTGPDAHAETIGVAVDPAREIVSLVAEGEPARVEACAPLAQLAGGPRAAHGEVEQHRRAAMDAEARELKLD